jgi:hypothetical protein
MDMTVRKFEPDFKNGGFWEFYKDLERQFEEFLTYVPYTEGNEETYSFRLANLLLSIGAHIDSALKEIAKYPDFQSKYPKMLNPIGKDGKTRYPTIKDYYPISEEYKLPQQVAVFKCLPSRQNVLPFEKYLRKSGKGNTPYWWKHYNNVKHNVNENFKDAKLETVRDALAGAFLLNVVHVPASERLSDYGLLKPNYVQGETIEQPIYDTFRGRKQHPERPSYKPIEDAFTIETSLFLYDYEEAKKLGML